MALHPKTINDFCRLCATESQSGVIIYSSEGENLCLEEKIINCLRIEVCLGYYSGVLLTTGRNVNNPFTGIS